MNGFFSRISRSSSSSSPQAKATEERNLQKSTEKKQECGVRGVNILKNAMGHPESATPPAQVKKASADQPSAPEAAEPSGTAQVVETLDFEAFLNDPTSSRLPPQTAQSPGNEREKSAKKRTPRKSRRASIRQAVINSHGRRANMMLTASDKKAKPQNSAIVRKLEEDVDRLQSQLERLASILDESMTERDEALEARDVAINEKEDIRAECNMLKEKVKVLTVSYNDEAQGRAEAMELVDQLQNEVFDLRGKTTEAAASRRSRGSAKFNIEDVPGTPADKHGSRNRSSLVKRASGGSSSSDRLFRQRSPSSGSDLGDGKQKAQGSSHFLGRKISTSIQRMFSGSVDNGRSGDKGSGGSGASKPPPPSPAAPANLPKIEVDEDGEFRLRDIEIVLSQVAIFRHMNAHEISVVARTMKKEQCTKGDFLFRQGEIGESFYILLEGQLNVICYEVGPGKSQKMIPGASARLVATLNPGQCFGETGLARSLPRTASVVAVTDSSCLRLHRKVFEDLNNQFDESIVENMKSYETYRESTEFVDELRQWLLTARTRDQYLSVLKKFPTLTLDLNSSQVGRKSLAGGPSQLERDLIRETGVSLNDELFSFHGKSNERQNAFDRFTTQLYTSMLKLLHKHNIFTEDNVKTAIEDVMFASNRTIAGGDSYSQTDLLFGNNDLVVLSPHSYEGEPSSIFINEDDCSIFIRVVNGYKISHFDEDMQVAVWATIFSTVSEEIRFDREKILRDGGNTIGDISRGRVSVRVLDLDVRFE